jgi:putative transposase
MARAHRHYLPDRVWHLTHRCHQRAFLLKFAKDKQRWLAWLAEARRRFGLRVLNYVVTSNHIHLLVWDSGEGVIPNSVQLIAGRTAQEFNHRKGRKGAFWEDRYHATAVETDAHLIRCLVYMDLNMVRAGVVAHPSEWPFGGYYELHHPPARSSRLDMDGALMLCGMSDADAFKRARRDWVDEALKRGSGRREAGWTESVAVGTPKYLEEIKAQLGFEVRGRAVSEEGAGFVLREPASRYGRFSDGDTRGVGTDNTYAWSG